MSEFINMKRNRYKLTQEIFEERSDKVHGCKYIYSEAKYKNQRECVDIICPIHGKFKQTPKNHMNGEGCPECGKEKANIHHKHNYKPFIESFQEKFGDNFSFPLIETEYVNNKTYVTVKCNKCGYIFKRRPNDLLSGKFNGCKNCKHLESVKKREALTSDKKSASKNRISKEMYLQRFKEKFGNDITPFMNEYVNTQKEINFKCNKCGYVFKRRPHNCLDSDGCPKCKHVANQKISIEEFVNRANEAHNNKYDYSKVEYNGTDKKVCVICHEKDKFGDEHGEFYVTPHAHIGAMKSGCPKCSGKFRKNTEYFIKESKLIHGDIYDYSKTEYVSALRKVEIICPKHGSFWITPNDHLNGKGCKRCGYDTVSAKLSLTTEDFINKAKDVHGDKYDYSKVNYVDSKTKVCIICQKHGEFLQSAVSHLRGKGCPKCKQSHLENEIMQMLEQNGIIYEAQKKFKWLGRRTLDFYIPRYNAAIECQGKQHFTSSLFGNFEDNIKNDLIKKQLCEEHGIKLLYYSNLGIKYPYEVYEDKEKLFSEIKKTELEEILKIE